MSTMLTEDSWRDLSIRTITERVEEIRRLSVEDPEMAAYLERRLHKDFIRLVAAGPSQFHTAYATAIFATTEIPFRR